MHPKRILVVDDEPYVAMVLAEALTQAHENCDVLTAENAAQALAQVGQTPLDLLITDLRMPGTDGLTLINTLRQTSPGMAVVLMTAFASELVRQQAAQLGVDRFMTKPFNLAEIRRVVRDVFERLEQVAPVAAASRETQREIRSSLGELVIDTGARCVLLTTLDGVLIERAGQAANVDVDVLATLMAANFAAMVEIARLLGHPRSFEAVNHESKDDNIYTCAVGSGHLLVVIYGLTVKPGTVWHYTKKLVEPLARAVQNLPPDTLKPAGDFTAALDGALFSEAAAGETMTFEEAMRRGLVPDVRLDRQEN
jgi:DNA-binding response OmpR family regulator